jgi:hypothetical protein
LALAALDDTPRRPRAILGNHYPLGGNAKSIERVLTDGLSAADWIRTLNEHFYVFPDQTVAESFRLRQVAAFGEANVRVIRFVTKWLPGSAQDKMRLSRINGGSLNGVAPRGRSTYQSLGTWMQQGAPKEIGFVSGLSSEEVRASTESDWVLGALA